MLDPGSDLAGQVLELLIVYADGTSEQVAVLAGTTDPSLADPPAAAPTIRSGTSADLARPGRRPDRRQGGRRARRLGLAGRPFDRRRDARRGLAGRGLVLSTDRSGPGYIDAYARPLALVRDPADPSRATVHFAPERDEDGLTLTLRLTFDDGTVALASVVGRPTDLSLRAPEPDPTDAVVAHPGDDLQSLANAHGAVRLAAGTYVLTQPLVLNTPVTISADPARRSCSASRSTPRPGRRRSRSTGGTRRLDGFAVRFDGPVRWDTAVAYGPAVIASTGLEEASKGGTKVNLVLSDLDLQGPPVTATNDAPASGVNLVRFATAESGRIVGNTLRGGTIYLAGGPWEVADNVYRGAVAGTTVLDVFSINQPRAVSVRDNVVMPDPGAGRTYRFLVLTQGGDDVQVLRNTVQGIGIADGDALSPPNAPEVILTEAYRVRFEGAPSAVTDGGRVVQIRPPQGEAPRPGDVLAVVGGPLAGQWRRIAQVIDPQTLVLDRPLPTGQPIAAVSVVTGFTGLVIDGNAVDERGRSRSSPLVLAGSHFGTEVRDNQFLGGADVRLTSYVSEQPVAYGWTHTPVLGLDVAGNTFGDVKGGVTLGTIHGTGIKTSLGRLYYDADLTGNTFSWSSAFLAASGGRPPTGIRLGDLRGLDPAESRVVSAENVAKVPPGTDLSRAVEVHLATLNGRELGDAYQPLPPAEVPAPTGLRLVDDTGSSATDRLTSDARLAFDRLSGTYTYQYRLAGQQAYQPLPGDPSSFLPAGLADGDVTVDVRAVDDTGRAGPDAVISFTLDTAAPPAVAGLASDGLGNFRFDPAPGASSYTYRVAGRPAVPIGAATAFRVADLPTTPTTVPMTVTATDPAGNVGPVASLAASIARPMGTWLGQRAGVDRVGPPDAPAGPDGVRDIGLLITGLPADRRVVSAVVTAIGGGRWRTDATTGSDWPAAIVQDPGTNRVELDLQPYRYDAGRPYFVTLTLDSGAALDLVLQGGPVDPGRPTAPHGPLAIASSPSGSGSSVGAPAASAPPATTPATPPPTVPASTAPPAASSSTPAAPPTIISAATAAIAPPAPSPSDPPASAATVAQVAPPSTAAPVPWAATALRSSAFAARLAAIRAVRGRHDAARSEVLRASRLAALAARETPRVVAHSSSTPTIRPTAALRPWRAWRIARTRPCLAVFDPTADGPSPPPLWLLGDPAGPRAAGRGPGGP